MWSVLAASVALAQDQPPTKPATEVQTCAQCHADLMTRRFTHGPTAQEKCLACHQYDQPAQHTFTLVAPTEQLCVRCHTEPLKTYAHQPVQQGRCAECHDPHGSDYRVMLRKDPVRELCQSCHTQWDAGKKPFVHGPVASGACILCHEPHSSWQPKLLVQTTENLCLGCHAEMTRAIDGARHVHGPVPTDCTSCHDAHASETRFQLEAEAPELCLQCHEDVKQSLETLPILHGAVTEPGGCLGCHAPHVSEQPMLQRHGQLETCLNCHDKPIRATDDTTLTNMAELLKDNPDHHGPIREGACSECHQPHGSTNARLLTEAYPPEFYAAFSMDRYALCFKCHITDMVTNAHGTGLTGFRNGDENLHFVHVNREKGRTCRACHEVHASRNPFHIRDSVPFGDKGWTLEIRFQQTLTGGSCSPGCHKTQTYSRDLQALKPLGGSS